MSVLETTLFIVLVVAVVLMAVLNLLGRKYWGSDPASPHFWKWNLCYKALSPLLALLALAMVNWGLKPFTSSASGVPVTFWQLRANDAIVLVAMVIIGWCFYRWIRIIEERLERSKNGKKVDWNDFFYVFVCTCLRGAVPPLLIEYLFLRLEVPVNYQHWIQKVPPAVGIIAWGWVLYRTLAIAEQFIIYQQNDINESLESRRVVTRVRILRQILAVLIGILMGGALLMLFKGGESLGAGLLASAGAVTVVLGIAAQHTFGTIFSGIQIALSQPIRIGDQVIVENEFGTVEEITLTYVVVKLWDLRRLVLPINYFIEKPFQNWTRTSTNVIGTVFLRVDFSAPVEMLRQQLRKIVEESPHWNGNTCALHVSDSNEVSMEIRLTASAPTATQSWELRCEIREKMLQFIQSQHPEILPKSRSEQKTVSRWGE